MPERAANSLRAFLDGPSRPAGALGYLELQGFLFAVLCAPELIAPSEWLPIALGEVEDAKFKSAEQAQVLLGEVMALYNRINTSVIDDTVSYPQGCIYREDVLSNFDDDAPIAQWARGFLSGHEWLSELWDEYLPDEIEDELAAASLVLCFFASRDLAEECLREAATPSTSLAQMADTMRRLGPDAMRQYAALGRAMRDALAQAERESDDTPVVARIGRNQPCPCGSGKKYKRCHGSGTTPA